MDTKRIIIGTGKFFLLALLALVAPLIVYIDFAIIGNDVKESSITEFTQEGLLLLSAIVFGVAARRYSDSRGFYVLVAGLFLCMLIREMDMVLDMVWHGFWIWPALFVAITSAALAFFGSRSTILPPMAGYFDSRPYIYLSFGFIIVLFFSRVFGSGSLLWKDILGEHYSQVFKTALQEGLELFGYLFIALGSVMTLFERCRQGRGKA
jgi:hypothetical protein